MLWRGDFRTPSRCGNALRMRRPAGERQCGPLIEPVEGAVDAGEARLPRADDGRGGETCAGDASPPDVGV